MFEERKLTHGGVVLENERVFGQMILINASGDIEEN